MSDSLRARLEKHLKGVSASTLDALAQRIWHLPADRAVASIDVGVGIGAVSLRAAVEMLRLAPDVAPLLSPEEMRIWGDVGARFAGSNPDVAIDYFERSASVLARIPQTKRGISLQFVARQAALSNRTALE